MANYCTHTACRTTAPCRYEAAGLPAPGALIRRDTVSDPMNHALTCPIRTAAAHSQPKCETCGRFARSLVSVPVIGSVTPEQVCSRCAQ